MAKTITVAASIEVPTVPNFVRLSDESGAIDIADLSDEGLCQIADAWRETLLANAVKRRAERPRT